MNSNLSDTLVPTICYIASRAFRSCNASKVNQRPTDTQFLHERGGRFVSDGKRVGSALLTALENNLLSLSLSRIVLTHLKLSWPHHDVS